MLNHEPNQAKLAREAFLDDVAVRLRRRLSPLDVYESVEEIGTHIDAMATAYQELGLPQDEAMAAALSKFGSAEVIGKSIAGCTQPATNARQVGPIIMTMASMAAIGGALMTLIDLWFVMHHHFWPAYGMDLAIGGAFGAFASGLGFFLRWKPWILGAALAGSIDLLLYFTLLKTYTALGKSEMNVEILISISSSAFIVGYASIRLKQFFQYRFPGRAVHQNQKALI